MAISSRTARSKLPEIVPLRLFPYEISMLTWQGEVQLARNRVGENKDTPGEWHWPHQVFCQFAYALKDQPTAQDFGAAVPRCARQFTTTVATLGRCNSLIERNLRYGFFPSPSAATALTPTRYKWHLSTVAPCRARLSILMASLSAGELARGEFFPVSPLPHPADSTAAPTR